MKKILIILPLLFLLSSCSESAQVNLATFDKNINEAFQSDIFVSNDVTTINEDELNISYWFPNNYNVCCALYCDKNTGIIKKYTVTSKAENALFNEFCETFEKAIYKSNKNITESSFKADGMVIKVYEDTRYTVKEQEPTLKSELDENALNYPVSEITSKPEN